MLQRKSQAATEFLITYGWVIVGVTVVISALAYFGIFNTDRYISDECSFGSQFYCEDSAFYYSAGSIDADVRIRNNFGQSITVHQIYAYYGGVRIPQDEITWITDPVSPTIAPGGAVGFQINFLRLALPKNDKARLRFVFEYSRSTAGAPRHNITGTVVGTVQ
jgi:hypothetical protein